MKHQTEVEVDEISSRNELLQSSSKSTEKFSVDQSQKIDKIQALQYRNSNMIKQKINNDYKSGTIWSLSLEDIGQYSIGFELYFLMLKQLCYLFLIISIISIWPIIENYNGSGLSEDQQDQLWNIFTLANQIRLSNNLSIDEALNEINSNTYPKIRIIIADMLYTTVFIFFIYYIWIKSRKTIKFNIKNNVSSSDYAIEIKGLPEDTVSNELKDFISSLYGDVIEVSLARKYFGRLTLFKTRTDLWNNLEYQIALSKVINNKNQKKIKKIQKKIKKFDKKIGKKFVKNLKHEELPVERAFIIFNLESSRNCCLSDFKNLNAWCTKYTNNYLFKNKYRLRVSIPSDPSNINWENLEYSSCKRFFRIILVWLTVLIIIIISIAIIYNLRTIDDILPSSTVCYNLHGANPNVSLIEAKNLYTTDTEIYCYCYFISIETILNNSDLTDYCNAYIRDRSLALMAKFLTCIGVAFTNYMIKIIFRALSRFEKIVSKSQERLKLMTKVFIGMFINTTFVILIVNFDFSSLGSLSYLPLKEYIFNGKYDDFTRDWYTQVGYILTMNMIVSVFSPHIINLIIIYPCGKCKRKFCLNKCLTQAELNKRFQPAEFDIATRYSQILNVIYCSFIFSSGIPLLNLTVFATFFILFWTDKFLIINHYAKPPRYSSEINNRFISILPFAAIFHNCFAIYMYGTSDIFPETFTIKNNLLVAENNTVYDRVISIAGGINIFLIAVALFYYINYEWKCFHRKNKNKVNPENAETERAYLSELVDIQEHGLHTYNILDNPDYSHLINSLNSTGQTINRLQDISYRTHQISEDLAVENDL